MATTTTTTAAAKQFGALSTALDVRLLRFFQKYPPAVPNPNTPNTSSSTSSSTSSLHPYQGPNPFSPHKNPTTGLWHNPKYSLRQQSDLIKLAETHGLTTLMPESIKSPEYRYTRRLEGLKVKGTGVGERVKGHWWERTLYTRLQKRRQAMLDMPNLIYKWKQVRISYSEGGFWWADLLLFSLGEGGDGSSGLNDCSIYLYWTREGRGIILRGVLGVWFCIASVSM